MWRVFFAGVFFAGVFAAGAFAAEGERSDAPARRPDVVLVTIDTLRSDALGFAGNGAVATPVLDRLAATGRVYTKAHAHNVVTLPSHANLLTGLYPYQHGVRDNAGFRLEAGIDTLASVFAAAGYATAAVVGAYPLDSIFGLDRGFEVYDDRYPEGSRPTEFVFPERPGTEVIAEALEWWRANRGRERFLWVHLFDPHAPYAPPEPFATRYRETPYLGEVAATDAALAPLLGPHLEGREPPALIVVTADHGEALGDHGELTHGLFAYEATLAVPLVAWGAGVAPGRDARPARHVDVFPTLLEAAGLAAGDGRERPGRSLLGPAAADAETYFEALSAHLNRGWAPLRGVIQGGGKLIALPLPELYDLERDPGESRNLVREERARARALRDALPRESAWPPPRGEISAEAAARLRSLGYLAGEAPGKTSYGAEDDPKNLIALDRALHQAIDLYSRGEPGAAAAVARRVVAERPTMAIAHSLLAQALLEAGQTKGALEAMTAARAAGVASEGLLRQLGLTLAEVGRAGEAVEVLRPLAAAGETETRNALALALSEAGRQDAARAVLAETLAADPDSSGTHELLALVALRGGRFGEAREHARRALELNERLPRAWNHLGVALDRLGEGRAALDAWERAAELDPELWDALYNLGTRAVDLGENERARRALGRFVAGAPEARYGGDLRRARVLLNRLERRTR